MADFELLSALSIGDLSDFCLCFWCRKQKNHIIAEAIMAPAIAQVIPIAAETPPDRLELLDTAGDVGEVEPEADIPKPMVGLEAGVGVSVFPPFVEDIDRAVVEVVFITDELVKLLPPEGVEEADEFITVGKQVRPKLLRMDEGARQPKVDTAKVLPSDKQTLAAKVEVSVACRSVVWAQICT